MKRKRCLFCGSTDLNREHVIPQWLSTELNVNALSVRGEFANVTRSWTSKGDFGLTVRAFCRATCNGGWMSDIENDVKPVLGPLVLGQRIDLSAAQQTTLATWVWKTSLTTHATHPRSRTTPDRDEYRRFFSERRPPDNAAVWVGGFFRQPNRASHLITRDANVLDETGNTVGRTSVFTAAIGAVIVQCVRTMAILPNTTITWNFADTERFCVRIWPPQADATRTPQNAIAGTEFEQFAKRFD